MSVVSIGGEWRGPWTWRWDGVDGRMERVRCVEGGGLRATSAERWQRHQSVRELVEEWHEDVEAG